MSRVRQLSVAMLAGVLLAMATFGCAMSPEQRAATERAWAERDAEKARECAGRGTFVAGACIRGGGP